jgi:hypothetical protein
MSVPVAATSNLRANTRSATVTVPLKVADQPLVPTIVCDPSPSPFPFAAAPASPACVFVTSMPTATVTGVPVTVVSAVQAKVKCPVPDW